MYGINSHRAEPPSKRLSEPPEPTSEPCRIAMMIATKKGAMTTATAAMMTG